MTRIYFKAFYKFSYLFKNLEFTVLYPIIREPQMVLLDSAYFDYSIALLQITVLVKIKKISFSTNQHPSVMKLGPILT